MSRRSRWAVILAGGDGTRLASLVRVLWGHSLPKQFVPLDGSRSLLQATLDRIEPLGFARRLVVVTREHEATARRQLRGLHDVEILTQPRNLDTAPGVLFPLAHIQARDPGATVALFPSDHHVPRPRPFLRAVDRALTVTGDRGSAPVVLLGVAADRAEGDYGWILPGEPLAGAGNGDLRRVERFIEKPDRGEALDLLTRGGLWNMFVLTGGLPTLWRLSERGLPEHTRRFLRFAGAIGRPGESARLEALYRDLPPANFCRDVLMGSRSLGVMKVSGSGWSDLGTPERYLRAASLPPVADEEAADLFPSAS